MLQKLITFLLLVLIAFGSVNGQRSAVTKKKEENRIAAIPLINYNRTQGVILGAIAAKYYNINKTDTVSPSSYTGIFGLYTAEKSYAVFGFSRLYFAKDRW